MSNELLVKADSIVTQANLPDRHSFFQLKNFLIGKENTIQGQLWQITREIQSRRENVETIQVQIEMALCDLELLDLSIAEPQFTFDHSETSKKVREIELRKMNLRRGELATAIEKLKRKIKYILEELQFLVNAYDTLSAIEPVKPFDCPESQANYWNEKLMEELNLRLLLNQKLDADFVKVVMALDDSAAVKVQMTKILENTQERLLDARRRLAAEKNQITQQ